MSMNLSSASYLHYEKHTYVTVLFEWEKAISSEFLRHLYFLARVEARIPAEHCCGRVFSELSRQYSSHEHVSNAKLVCYNTCHVFCT